MGWKWPALVISLAATALVMGVRQIGLLERWELSAYDQWVRSQPDPGVDSRILVIAITEADIQALQQWPVSDRTLSQVLTKLEQYQPRVIGLDIYRDVPIEPGNIELKTDLQINDRVVAVCQSSESNQSGVAPPPTVPTNRLGFSDFVVDPDGIVRRYLMSLTPATNSKCRINTAFSLQLALRYLNYQHIRPQMVRGASRIDELQIGSTRFSPLQVETGGYRNLDARGYQILLRYRSPAAVARQISLQSFLKGDINPAWVKDKIVLVGVTAASGNDFHLTPYAANQPSNFRMPGVILHAQMVSQILCTVLDRQPLIWYWPGWLELIWIGVWAIVGVSLALQFRRPWFLVASSILALGILAGSCLLLFTLSGWVPIIPPALSLAIAIVGAIVYKSDKRFDRAALKEENATVQQPTLRISVPHPEISPARQGIASLETGCLLQGRYKIIDLLSNGRGGFGQTYLAQDTKRPGCPVCVVKQLQPLQRDPQQLQVARSLFQREAETLEAVGEHDQIPRLLAYFEETQEFYIVQEFIQGKVLSELLRPGECLPESQVVDLLQDVLPVLNFIHRRGVIHRDLKPANLIRRKIDGRMVLIDFGAVKLLQAQFTEQTLTSSLPTHTIIIGTNGYAPPEQMVGEPVYSSDLYALGMIGIQALTGKSPRPRSVNTDTQEARWQDQVQVQAEFAAILDKMTHPDLQERFQTTQAVLQRLQSL
jgi:CHASE2 domain-containing sensor protein